MKKKKMRVRICEDRVQTLSIGGSLDKEDTIVREISLTEGGSFDKTGAEVLESVLRLHRKRLNHTVAVDIDLHQRLCHNRSRLWRRTSYFISRHTHMNPEPQRRDKKGEKRMNVIFYKPPGSGLFGTETPGSGLFGAPDIGSGLLGGASDIASSFKQTITYNEDTKTTKKK